MKTPKYTDLHRYPNGYVKPEATNVKATFRRLERERKAKEQQDALNAAEAEVKVAKLKRTG